MYDGGCLCGAVRFRPKTDPWIVHACHCQDFQRLSGGAFVINAWIERDQVAVLEGEPVSCDIEAGSGKPHSVHFFAQCGTHVWSQYNASPADGLFVRVGALDDPSVLPPDVHIFTRSKPDWVVLDDGKPVFNAFYDLKTVWPSESLARLRTVMQGA